MFADEINQVPMANNVTYPTTDLDCYTTFINILSQYVDDPISFIHGAPELYRRTFGDSINATSHVMADPPLHMEPTPPSLHRTQRTHDRVHPYNPMPTPRKRYRTAQAVDTANNTSRSSSLSASVTSTKADERGCNHPQPQNRRRNTRPIRYSQALANTGTGSFRHHQRHSEEVESPSSSSSSSSSSPSSPSTSVFSAVSPASSTTSVSSSSSTQISKKAQKSRVPTNPTPDTGFNLGPQEPDTHQGIQQKHTDLGPRKIAKRKPCKKSPQ
ncbi:hypothetical protein CVT24_002997 [Panaeolus cyanescens]|uniref:Uncharacterized protein n=1 Tax=Panaeolus cyanescens TaxID=181874 RepID=A0A409YXX4_9AGAR|nr:hypothetical protein CVT24_002997 [Panaeolus cyanescens]